jgi:hypothetical protein
MCKFNRTNANLTGECKFKLDNANITWSENESDSSVDEQEEPTVHSRLIHQEIENANMLVFWQIKTG